MQQKGYTISELLIAMVIIAVLGAMGTPAFLAARENAQKNKDISNLNTIRTALQTYYTDRGEYPKSLYGCVNHYNQQKKLIPPPDNNIEYGLYPRKINIKEVFKSEKQTDKPPVDQEDSILVSAQYPRKPNQPNVAVGKKQCFGPLDGFVNIGSPINGSLLKPPVSPDSFNSTKYYKFSIYDVAKVPDNDGKHYYELRYTRFWTFWGLTTGNPDDDPRQLGYTYPPENTVVTWNSCYRKYNQGTLTNDSKDLVLFLSGTVKQISSQTVIKKAWTTLPTDK